MSRFAYGALAVQLTPPILPMLFLTVRCQSRRRTLSRLLDVLISCRYAGQHIHNRLLTNSRRKVF